MQKVSVQNRVSAFRMDRASIICVWLGLTRRVVVHTVITRSLILPYSTAEMYSLVDDVDRYHEFLPWCEDFRGVGTQRAKK